MYEALSILFILFFLRKRFNRPGVCSGECVVSEFCLLSRVLASSIPSRLVEALKSSCVSSLVDFGADHAHAPPPARPKISRDTLSPSGSVFCSTFDDVDAA